MVTGIVQPLGFELVESLIESPAERLCKSENFQALNQRHFHSNEQHIGDLGGKHHFSPVKRAVNLLFFGMTQVVA